MRKEFFIVLTLIFTILCYILFHLGLDLKFIFGDLGDARFNNYILEHGYQFLLGNHSNFWSPPFFFPEQNVASYSDNLLGTLPIYGLFRILGLDLETAFQLWIITFFLLNGISCYIVLRLLGFEGFSGLIGAIFFSLSAPIMIFTVHIQLLPHFAIPWIFYSIYQYSIELKVRYIYYIFIWVVIQFYMGLYLALFSLIGIFMFGIIIFIYKYKDFNLNRSLLKLTILTHLSNMILAFIFLYPLLYPYFSTNIDIGGREWWEVSSMLPRISSWFFTSGHYFDEFNNIGKLLPMQHEHRLFIGLIPILSIFISIIVILKSFKRSGLERWVILSIYIIALVIILTLSFGKTSIYYYTFFQLPGFDAIRAVTRIVILILFPVSMIIAYLISLFINSKITLFWKIPFTFIFIGLLFLEQFRGNISKYEKAEAQERYLNLMNKIEQTSDFDVIDYQYIPNYDYAINELDAMYLGLILQKPTINGYSGNLPSNYSVWNFSFSRQIWYNENYHIFKDLRILECCLGKMHTITPFLQEELKSKTISKNFKFLNDFHNELELERISRISLDAISVQIRIKNTSNETWASKFGGIFTIVIAYALSESSELKYSDFQNYLILPYDIHPNESVTLKLILKNPEKDLHITMVQGITKWFQDYGGKILHIPKSKLNQALNQ